MKAKGRNLTFSYKVKDLEKLTKQISKNKPGTYTLTYKLVSTNDN